jgi:predicted flap endonuclease-1-like 5' DNA nuclease
MADTVPGGRYLVGGVYVDAEGKPVKEKSKAPAKPEGAEQSPPAAYPYADILTEGGFKDWAAVVAAKDEDLVRLNGIGPARLKEIREYNGA